jgi:acetoin utilization deacetylase AcuC-like enzyme
MRRHKVVVVGAKGCEVFIPSASSEQATFDTVEAYGLFKQGVRRVEPKLALRSIMEDFHSEKYLQCIECDGTTVDQDSLTNETGLTPANLFKGMWKYCRLVTGATLVATNELVTGNSTLAISWMGGHSKAAPEAAIGHSFVNDTALAVFALRRRFSRIAVIDLSATHPAALQDAFYYSGNVFTVSVHRYDKHHHTYNTGRRKEKGAEGEGRHTNLNVNMSSNANDQNLLDVVKEITVGLANTFAPDCVVCTIGTSGLAGNCSKLKYSPHGIAIAVDSLLKMLDVPTLLLGGDNEWRGEKQCGQHARMWTLIVDAAVNATKGVVSTLANDIPDEDNPSWKLMGPSFELIETLETDQDESNETMDKRNTNYNDNTAHMHVKLNGIRERFRKYERCHGKAGV